MTRSVADLTPDDTLTLKTLLEARAPEAVHSRKDLIWVGFSEEAADFVLTLPEWAQEVAYNAQLKLLMEGGPGYRDEIPLSALQEYFRQSVMD